MKLVFILYGFVISVVCSQTKHEISRYPVRGVRVSVQKQIHRPSGNLIVPVSVSEERKRQIVAFIDKAGRRIIRLIDFVYHVLDKRSQLPINLKNRATSIHNLTALRARHSFMKTAASKLENLENDTRRLFEELIGTAKALPVVTGTNRKFYRVGNKNRNRKMSTKRKGSKPKKFRKVRLNKKKEFQKNRKLQSLQ